jgi:hypothetical protein
MTNGGARAAGDVPETEAMMQDFSGKQARLSNPFLDLTVAALEAQLKAWQTYQVEGTRFIAKRMRANLEHLRALGHCCEVQSVGECQRTWVRECQADYAEECGRIAATTFELCYGDLAGMGWLFGRRARELWPQAEPRAQTGPQFPSRPQGQRQAA